MSPSMSSQAETAAPAPKQPIDSLFAFLGTCAVYGLLAIVLAIPSSTLSQKQLCLFLVPVIIVWLAYVYTWPGIDVVMQIICPLFYAMDVLVWRDVRGTFKRIHRSKTHTVDQPAHSSSSVTSNGHVNGVNGITSSKAAQAVKPPCHADAGIWEEPHPSTIVSRLKWSCYLICSPRFGNWTIGDARHDAAQLSRADKSISRPARILQLLNRFVIAYMLADIFGLWALHDPYFDWRTNLSITSPLPPETANTLVRLLGQGKVSALAISNPRFWRVLISATPAWASIEAFFAMPGLIFLSLGGLGTVGDQWGHPAVWRPASGSLVSIADRGLRGFWGDWWHQMMRCVAGDPGKILGNWYLRNVSQHSASSRAKGAPSTSSFHSFIAHAIHISTAFFLSGVMHAGMVPKAASSASPLHLALFFWVQVPGILIELFVERVFFGEPTKGQASSNTSQDRRKKSMIAKIVRFTWALFYLYTTFPFFGEQLVALRLWDMHAVPLSPCRWLFRGEGIGFWTWEPRHFATV
ncbi:hypothetical protein L228DRAFT_116928 [Xylona heveae TC161]|uniref:Wax synthase domain-containing protein n=1 Tax=Xylona heveae (strain CBS 132557 / TC161) TaxID=1328760 RepID=A0A165HGB5_XYLHT|nr:hypothetical protein L228DRAFT_116928 [Xylona heveae TC161]KZF23466.1 hypothetical protein L228DRAFT_116928 [Xylona heveae TC161]